VNQLFAAFDLFPSAKGAATHIAHTAQALADARGRLTLACLGTPEMPRWQEEGPFTLRRCADLHPNFLRRTEGWGAFLSGLLDAAPSPPTLVHFRDVWSGLPLLRHPACAGAVTVFEVNALPSVELPVHYPALHRRPDFLSRLRAVEGACLAGADGIVTVSEVSRRWLVGRGVPSEKIAVIPNAAHLPASRPARAAGRRLVLYAGTLSPWQGIETLLEATALLSHRDDFELLLAASSAKHAKPVRKAIARLGLSERVRIETALERDRLAERFGAALFSVAPLARCDRNELQGCSPLKIVESMAAGTAVVASDLPVCRELLDRDRDGLLVSPGSPRALAAAMEALLDDPARAEALGRAGRTKVEARFGYPRYRDRLAEFVDGLQRRRRDPHGTA
jgi:glycosyltransferase involved in cell wall biosynthesis